MTAPTSSLLSARLKLLPGALSRVVSITKPSEGAEAMVKKRDTPRLSGLGMIQGVAEVLAGLEGERVVPAGIGTTRTRHLPGAAQST